MFRKEKFKYKLNKSMMLVNISKIVGVIMGNFIVRMIFIMVLLLVMSWVLRGIWGMLGRMLNIRIVRRLIKFVHRVIITGVDCCKRSNSKEIKSKYLKNKINYNISSRSETIC